MVIKLPVHWILIIDIIAWLFFHMSISLASMKVSDSWFEGEKRGFNTWKWEKNGEIYQTLFNIRAWKKYLPDGSNIIKNAYDKTNLHGTDSVHLKKFIIETKRAELTHWALLLPVPIFFIWNPFWAGIIMIIYAAIVNVPFIITQRYNRPRLEKMYQSLLKREKKRTMNNV